MDQFTFSELCGRDLRNCCVFNDINDAREILDLDNVEMFINYVNLRGQSPLYIACEHGHYDIVKLLLDHEADINILESDSCNFLTATIINGHSNIVELLLDHGINVNQLSNRYWSSLMIACRYSQKDIVNILLARGANVNYKNAHNNCALDMAVHSENKDVVEIILRHGASINHYTFSDASMIHQEIFEILVTHDRVDDIAKTISFFQAVWPSSCCNIKLPFPPEIIIHIASMMTKYTFSIPQFERLQRIATELVPSQKGTYRIEEMFEVIK